METGKPNSGNSTLRDGALAMFDALGFSGIWQRHDPTEVIEKLRRLRQWAVEDLNKAFGGTVQMAVSDRRNATADAKFELLSDTVVIGVQNKHADELDWPQNHPHPQHELIRQEAAIKQTAHFASQFMQQALADEPRLTYRGCITFGKFLIEENFLVGEAVDKAAQLMNRSEGAIVWLTPEALNVLEPRDTPGLPDRPRMPFFRGRVHQHPLMRYNVPIKGGSTYETLAVSLANLDQMGDREWSRFKRRTLATFVGGLDVQVKRQNTEAFLDRCRLDAVLRTTPRRQSPELPPDSPRTD